MLLMYIGPHFQELKRAAEVKRRKEEAAAAAAARRRKEAERGTAETNFGFMGRLRIRGNIRLPERYRQ